MKPSVYRVEINGATHPSWESKRYTTTGTGAGYELRLYNLGRDNSTLPGSEICFLARGACNSLSALCKTSVGECK